MDAAARRQAAARSLYVYCISAVAGLSGLLFGFDTAVINGALPFLRVDFQLSDWEVELAAGVLLWGCVFGAAGAGWIGDRLGRRKALLVAAVLFTVSAIGCAIPRGLPGLSAARFAAGLAIGTASALAPMYIAEISPARLRGRLVSLNQLAIVTGILLAYFVNWKLATAGEGNWRWMFATAALPSVGLFVGLLAIPESPRWLLQKGRSAAALAVLERTVAPEEARTEIEAITRSIREESRLSFRDLLRPPLRTPLKLAVALAILCQVTGINTIIYYGSILLREQAGQSATSAIGANVLIGVINLAGTIVALFTIDRLGRRALLLGGAAGMGLALAALGFAFRLQPPPFELTVVCILAYVAFFSVSFGPGVWVYISELFPNAVRARAVSVGTVCVWVACLAVTLTFLSLVEWLTAAGAFWLYGALCVVAFLFVLVALPETKGKSLEEIEEGWKRQPVPLGRRANR